MNSEAASVDFKPHVEVAVDQGVTRVTFFLEGSWRLPDHYYVASREAIQESLALGAESYLRKENWIRGLSADEVCGEAVAAMTEEYKEKAAKAVGEVEGLRRRLSEAVAEAEKARRDAVTEAEKARRDVDGLWSGKFAAAIGQIEAQSKFMAQATLKHQYQVEALEEKVRGVEIDVRERVSRERDEMWRRVEEVGTARVADLERRLGAVEERRRELEEKLTARMVVAASSSLRGAAGEEDFGELLRGAGLTAESTGKQSHMCDYKGMVDGVDVFYEVKNHESVLREDQIVKFLRDMKEHPEVGVGVFVALKLPLPGRRRGRGIVVEWLEDRRMVIFCGELLGDGGGGGGSGQATMELIKKFVEAGVRVRKMILDMEADGEGGGASAEVGRLMGRIKRGQGYLEMVSERARGLFNKMRIDAKTVEAIHDSSLAQVKMMREEIKMTVGAFLGEDMFGCDDGVGGVPVTEPTGMDASGSLVAPSYGQEADSMRESILRSGWENVSPIATGQQELVSFIAPSAVPAPRKRAPAKSKAKNLPTTTDM